MRVEEFAYAADLEAFNKDVQSRSAEVPKWPSDGVSNYATGAFWVEIDDYPKSVVRSVSIENWQKTVSQLLERRDFASTGPFYRVVQSQELKSARQIEMNAGQFALSPNTDYELIVDHFLPKEQTANFQLEVVATGQVTSFITGPKLQIDSPYDRHWIRFKTLDPLLNERAVMTVTKKATGEEAAVQFDLPIMVSGRRAKTIGIGFVVGFLLALPQIITLWVNPSFTTKSAGWWLELIGFILVLDIIVGIAAAVNFRKPI